MTARDFVNRLPCVLLRLISHTFFCMGLLLSSFALSSPTQAATAITETTGVGDLGTQILPPSGNVYGITGGKPVGNNLYHSFAQFNVGTGDVAQFQTSTPFPNTTLSNILARVTGGNPSSIFGTIDSVTYYPGANLFLMNPHGIIFGPNATLNVGGSVAFTTANYLRLTDNARFEAIPGTQDVLLSASSVASFGFLGSNPAAISVQGSTLSVQTGQSLQLVGGSHGFTYMNPDTGARASMSGGVTMTGGRLSAPGGQIGIASLASPGEIFYRTMVAGPNIHGETFTDQGPISMSGGATINVSGNGGGTIRIRSGEFIMENAFLVANTTGSSDGIPVAISLDVVGDIALTNRSAISAQTLDTGRGGNMEITSANLSLSGGSRIGTQTSGTGQAGDITITVSDITSLVGTDNLGDPSRIESVTIASGTSGSIDLVASRVTLDNRAHIRTQASGDGPAGDITLHVGNLRANNGSRIESAGSESAPSGNIRITAADTITLSGQFDESNKSGIEIKNEGFGGTGIIALDTNNLVMSDGARVFHNTSFSLATPENPQLSVHAHNSITMTTGSEIRVFNFGGDAGALNLSAQTINLSDSARVTTDAFVDGNGGDINITAGQSVTLNNGSSISASSTGLGNAGNISINAGQQFEMRNSSVKTEAAQASGGNIDIRAVDRVRLVNSSISTSVIGGSGGGGNITIDPNVVVLQNSQVIAQAIQGNGGNITITTPLFLADSTSLVSASSQFGLNGTVTIQSPTSNLSGSLGTLSSKPNQAQSLLTQRCAALANGQASSFVVAGREQLPADPGGWLSAPIVLAEIDAERFGEGTVTENTSNLEPRTSGLLANDRVSLRRLTPVGFLIANFADSEATGCHS